MQILKINFRSDSALMTNYENKTNKWLWKYM